ncbi:cytochrome C oxidase subunit IV family protein [Acanthopleuribacter pedis]|uniref:Cytochrome C oxidase subunit IV family protein n=1 Tax=Acanthopleuribacter pedis TaxID=442870 RepID=A0A8J7U8K2_9BACT|nr:cytochrome C oxidase subunit IV family protein [Acanthopleuribacter pedis]MBO1322641.1 cytochrome C oxidase subunit IV family protein [Acanthopleuribacter pedis]
MGHDHHDDHHGEMGHIQAPVVYYGTFGALIALTLLTVFVASFETSPLMHDLIAMGIATVKATLVIVFFMHGKYEKAETWGFIWAPIILLATLLGALFIDYAGRQNDLYIEKTTIKELYINDAKSILDGKEHGGDHGDAKKDDSDH